METLQLVWRAFEVFAERRKEQGPDAGAEHDRCLASETSEAFRVAAACVGAVCDAKPAEYDAVVAMLKHPNVFGKQCTSGSCPTPPGSSTNHDARRNGVGFEPFLTQMARIRNDPVLMDALPNHAVRKRYELAAYIAAWEPASRYGVVLDLAGEHVYSAETGARTKVRDCVP